MRVPNAGQEGKLPKNVADQNQLRDAPITLEQLAGIIAEIEKGLTKDTPQEQQYIQLHIRQVRGLLQEVSSIQIKLDAALAAVRAAQEGK